MQKGNHPRPAVAFCFLGTRETSVAHHLAIEMERVGRIYKPRGRKGDRQPRVALDEVTLSVRPGEIFGLRTHRD